MTSREIAKFYNTSKTKVLLELRKYGITKEDQSNDYSINMKQHDFIVGSILGDGTFCTDGGNYRMSFRQAENQKDYLQFKLEIMKDFCKKKTYGISDGNQKATDGRSQLMYYFHTRALELFNQYQEKNIASCLNQLNKNSFSIWMMDDGSFKDVDPSYTPYYTLSAKRFIKEEIELAQRKLKENLGIEAHISVNKSQSSYPNGKICPYRGFYFPTSETKKIQELILSSDFGEDILRTMSYKFNLMK